MRGQLLGVTRRRRSQRKRRKESKIHGSKSKGKAEGKQRPAGRKAKGNGRKAKAFEWTLQVSFSMIFNPLRSSVNMPVQQTPVPLSRPAGAPGVEPTAPRFSANRPPPIPWWTIADLSDKGKPILRWGSSADVSHEATRPAPPRSRAPSRRREASRSGWAGRRSAGSAPALSRRGGTPRRGAGRSPDPARLRRR